MALRIKLFGEEQFRLIHLPFESESFGCCRFQIYLSLRSRREGIGRKGKRERDWGERLGDAWYKNPLLFISADAGVCKFLIG